MTCTKFKAEEIDALLPQTQCGLCGYGGCMPYAEAIANSNAPINLCPPGGVNTLVALANLVGQNPSPFIADMQQKAKPKMIAVIRENECIGCTKCIQACPVDAILGGAKQMHTVITDECTGCELCLPPCPVDCIDLVLHPEQSDDINTRKANHARDRFNAREKRLSKNNVIKENIQKSMDEKINYIEAAILRAKAKKISKQEL